MPVKQPSQYQVDNMRPGDMIYVQKKPFLYRTYRKLFLDLPKIKVKKYISDNCDEYEMHYQEDCTLLYEFEVKCVQTYDNVVPCIISTDAGKSPIKTAILESLQVGIYNVMLTFKSGLTLTLPVDYFSNGIRKNQIQIKQIDDRRMIEDVLKFQRYKGNYFKKYVEEHHIDKWVAAYCSVCGNPVEFHFEGDMVIIDNKCDCGELKLEKSKFDYDEFSIWFYNQTSPIVRKRYDEFWLKRS